MPKVNPHTTNGDRGRRGRRVATTLAEINVIPLVDVMLVLLIIFMVAAPMLQRGVEVNLPVARQTQRMSEERLYVTVPLTFSNDRRVYLDDEAISIDFLAERIRQATLGNEQRSVYLRSDGAVQMQQMLEVMGHLKAAGIERVGIVALEKPGS